MNTIKIGTDAYTAIETILNKIATDNNIEDIKSIDIKLSADEGLVIFKKAQNPATTQAQSTPLPENPYAKAQTQAQSAASGTGVDFGFKKESPAAVTPDLHQKPVQMMPPPAGGDYPDIKSITAKPQRGPNDVQRDINKMQNANWPYQRARDALIGNTFYKGDRLVTIDENTADMWLAKYPGSAQYAGGQHYQQSQNLTPEQLAQQQRGEALHAQKQAPTQEPHLLTDEGTELAGYQQRNPDTSVTVS